MRQATLLCVYGFLFWLFAQPAQAHSLSTAHVRIFDDETGALHVELDVALRDAELALAIDANQDAQITWGELKSREQQLRTQLLMELALSRDAAPCVLTPLALKVRAYADGTYAHLPARVQCTNKSGKLELRYPLFFAQDASHRAVVTLQVNGRVDSAILSAQRQSVVFAEVGSSGIFSTYLREGVHHILIGYDHIAFLISLLLPLALLSKIQQRIPLLESLKRGAWLVTAFTLAHSITLSIAALGWVVPASQPVEILIALSVVLAAMNNVWVWVSRPWLLASCFGLIHGFGFAGALGELGLPNGARLLGLLAFNIGVELGQIAIAAIVLPLVWWLSGFKLYRHWVLIPLSAAIAGLGVWWIVERLG